jgi:large subunit ribosomal protein L24
MAAPLSSELAASKKTKSLPVRKGDTVRVVRGDHIGFEGKVNRVDLKHYRIFLEGLTREKVDGTNIFVSVHPSKVIIKNLKLDDKWRKVILERKKELEPKKEKKVKKPKKAVEKTAETTAEAEEEKAVEKKPELQEKPVEEAPKTVKKAVPKKPAATKKKAEPAEKDAKPKTAKKTPVKRKAASKTNGGT